MKSEGVLFSWLDFQASNTPRSVKNEISVDRETDVMELQYDGTTCVVFLLGQSVDLQKALPIVKAYNTLEEKCAKASRLHAGKNAPWSYYPAQQTRVNKQAESEPSSFVQRVKVGVNVEPRAYD